MNSTSVSVMSQSQERVDIGKGAIMDSIRSVLKCLLELQALDRQIAVLKQGREDPATLQLKKQELERLRIREQEKITTLERLRLERGQTKNALEFCRQRIVKADSASKELNRPAAFQAKMKELDQLKELERTLELKERAVEKENETIRAQAMEIQNERKSIEAQIQEAASASSVQDHEVATKVREIDSLKSEIISRIPVKYVISYQDLMSSRGGIAIAQIRASACNGCHMILPAQFVNDLSRARSIEQCPSCKRILIPERL